MKTAPRFSRPTGTRPPESDVSPFVGLAGLAGLAFWIVVCRQWPGIVDALALGGPREPMVGPYAALSALVFTGLPMVLWSVFVDKVHRRASTGIDWSRPRSLASVRDISITKIAGLWGTWAIIGCLYCLARWYWGGQYLFAMQVLGAAIVPLLVLSVPYVLWLDRVMVNPKDHAWHFGAMLLGREPYDMDEVKKHWRAWIIKGFFGAFMISILPPGFAKIVGADFGAIAGNPVELALHLFALLFLIDVMVGTVGYLVTLRPLDAHIRSGNPFLAGWLAALMCYPPFSVGVMAGGGIVNYEVDTPGWSHWFAGNEVLLWAWGAWLVFLTAAYAWATVAFGLRFSNLTYRGVLTNGPYRFTRHPAYLSKNLFWWCTVLPFMTNAGSLTDIVRNTFFLAVVSGIYYWRARTEEAHLMLEDERYTQYWHWMARHGLVTGALTRLRERFRRPASVPALAEPAE